MPLIPPLQRVGNGGPQSHSGTARGALLRGLLPIKPVAMRYPEVRCEKAVLRGTASDFGAMCKSEIDSDILGLPSNCFRSRKY